MPTFEMSLGQLRSYTGRNPRPADFDAYWDRALNELDATDPNPRLVPHASPAGFAECFDLWFTGVGQAQIHAQYVRPHSGTSHPAVLKFHGYSGNAGNWFDQLPWAAQGIATAVLDVRGQGGLFAPDDPSRGGCGLYCRNQFGLGGPAGSQSELEAKRRRYQRSGRGSRPRSQVRQRL